jgi:hypothetical protein
LGVDLFGQARQNDFRILLDEGAGIRDDPSIALKADFELVDPAFIVDFALDHGNAATCCPPKPSRHTSKD